ncbi:MAG: LamG domain-containing protein [Anaerolineae bacterium]|nr:LamG domain-containing protein [Anaerolineae bacterium]
MGVGIGLATGRPGASTGGGGVPSFLTDLIEYWPLADLVGEHAGRVLTNNGSVTFGAGHIDQCAAFSGSNYLDMAAPASLQTGDIDYTLAAWVKLNSVVANSAIISQGQCSSELWYDGGWDTFSFTQWRVDGGDSISAGSGSYRLEPASTGTWYHVVGWYTASDGKAHLRVNAGTERISSAAGFTPAVSSSNFAIGRRPDGAHNMDGYISDAAFWKRALTSAEIVDLYAAGTGLAYPFA